MGQTIYSHSITNLDDREDTLCLKAQEKQSIQET